MPPWHADPHYGTFVNERGLSPEQAQTLERWVESPWRSHSNGEDWPLGIKFCELISWAWNNKNRLERPFFGIHRYSSP